jgi:peptide/nickel transport system ATP-binding protein
VTLLSVRDLHVRFSTPDGVVRAVDGVDLDVRAGETVCLVGESGSGKTVLCESLTKLTSPPAEIPVGEVRFDGEDLFDRSERGLREVRGARIGHVFQNPQGSLDPVYTVGEQVAEAVRLHRDVSRSGARERALDLLGDVGIGDPEERFDDYPHQFSGGMKQRVAIAAALAPDPDLLVADEPTTALDATVQARVLDLFRRIQRDRGTAVLFVTHDLGVVAQVADRVAVMYAGEVMERADVYDLFDDPAHPYTRALLDCLPGHGRFEAIDGSFPEPTDLPTGCRFHPRCPHAVEDCATGDHPGFATVDREDPPETPLEGQAAPDDAAGLDADAPDAPDRATDAPHEVSCLLYGPGYRLPDDLAERRADRATGRPTTGAGREDDATDGGDRE